MPLFFRKIIAFSHGEEKGRVIVFWKMAYYIPGFYPVGPGKILCNAGDGCAAFAKSKDEKSVPAKLKLKTSCIREQTRHCPWSDQEWKVLHVLLCSYRSEFVTDCILPHQTFTLLVALGGVRQFLSGGFGKQSAQPLWAFQHHPKCLWQTEFWSTKFEEFRFVLCLSHIKSALSHQNLKILMLKFCLLTCWQKCFCLLSHCRYLKKMLLIFSEQA